MRNSIVTCGVTGGLRRGVNRAFLAAIAGSLVGVGLTAEASAGRVSLAKMAVQVPSNNLQECDLIVKFRDDSRVRAHNGRLLSQTAADLAPIQALLDAHGATVQPRIAMTEVQLLTIATQARLRSGRTQPDMGGIIEVNVDAVRMALLANALNERPEVEIVQIVAAPLNASMPCVQTDFPPATPDYRAFQTYRGSAAEGGVRLMETRVPAFIDVDEDGTEGIFGEGISIGDVEQCYLTDHEDLCFVTPEVGQTPSCLSGPDHGTAVLGVMAAIEDTDPVEPNIGMGGLSPMSDYYFFPAISNEEGPRVATAIMSATATLPAGSILLIEQQRTVYPADPFGDPFNVPYVPAETSFDVWLATRQACDAGIIVVAAAGNGKQDLDGGGWVGPPGEETFFQFYGFYLAWGDSGAIIVGAGSADADHDRLVFSTFGSRIDMQGWGVSVATLGYGDLLPIDGLMDDRQFYTLEFSGTSSATPIVAGVAAMLQGLQLEVDDASPYSSEAMRDLLKDTGAGAGAGWEGVDAPDWFEPPPFPDAYAAATAVIGGGVGPQYGACCLNDNTCMEIDTDLEANCWLTGGTYRGAGTSCSDYCGNTGETVRLTYAGAGASDEIGTRLTLGVNGAFAGALAPARMSFPPNPTRIIYRKDVVTGWEIDGQLPGTTTDTSVSLSIDAAGEQRFGVGSMKSDNSDGEPTGTVDIYRRTINGVWEYEDTLSPSMGMPSGLFGSSMLLDGNVAIVGDCGWASEDNPPGGVDLEAGQQVHVFTRSPLRVWTESGVVENPGPAFFTSRFGDAIAMAGNLLIVGAPQTDVPDEDLVDVGAVYLYQLQGNSLAGFTLSPVDVDADGQPDQLVPTVRMPLAYWGEAIDAAVMTDGTIRVAVGQPGVRYDEFREGSISIYDIDPVTFAVTGPTVLMPTTLGAADRFGTSVDLSADGLVLAGGTDRGETEDGDATGFCWAWHWLEVDGTTAWREMLRLQNRFPGNGDQVGASVVVGITVGGGTEVLAGAPGAVGDLEPSGAVLVWPADFIDCDVDGVHDPLAIAQGLVVDMFSPGGVPGPDGIPDSCNGLAASDRAFGDCNGDGIPDWFQDIVDVNGNGRDDACDEPCFSQWSCPGDTRHNDGSVNRDDLLAVLEYWGSDATDSVARRCDIWPGAGQTVLDGDGRVDILDLITVIRNWGACESEALPDDYCFTLDLDSDGTVDMVYPGWYR